MTKSDALTNRMESVDKLFLIIFQLSLSVPAIGGKLFGIEERLLWIPSLVFFFWVLDIGYYRVKIKFAEYPELSFVERVRGWTYGVTLIVTLLFNSLGLSLVSKADVIGAIVIDAVTVVTVGTLMSVLAVTVIKLFFEREWSLLTTGQKDGLVNTLKEAGVASIYFSMAIITFQNIVFLWGISTLLVVYVLFLYFLTRLYYCEARSRALANGLADSLVKSRWERRLQNLIRQRRKKRSV